MTKEDTEGCIYVVVPFIPSIPMFFGKVERPAEDDEPKQMTTTDWTRGYL